MGHTQLCLYTVFKNGQGDGGPGARAIIFADGP